MKNKIWNSKNCQRIFLLSVVFILSLIMGCGKKEEEYRQIQVYKIDGTATVERQESRMEVYENMQLSSGDMVETASNSYLQLKLDEDKYILLEPDSKICLQATGNSVDSNTSIFLEKGAIVNQIDNPLSEDSNYQVTTPNSTMAVRGTTFRVEITYDEKGDSYAKVAVYGGKVECNLVFPDGTVAEPLLAETGTQVLVWGDDKDSEYIENGNTSYEELKEKVIDFLGVIIDRGEELSITKEELAVLKEAIQELEESETENKDEDESIVNSGQNPEETEPEVEEPEVEEPDPDLEENSEETKKKQNSEQPVNEEEKEEEKTQDEAPTQTPTASTEGSDSGESGGTTAGGATTGGNTNGGNTNGGNTSGNNNTSTSTKEITVRFCNSDGLEFATKKMYVKANAITVSGTDISTPVLQPTASGGWGIGDSIAIVNDTITINWVINKDTEQ